jgi:hypothetical protein
MKTAQIDENGADLLVGEWLGVLALILLIICEESLKLLLNLGYLCVLFSFISLYVTHSSIPFH